MYFDLARIFAILYSSTATRTLSCASKAAVRPLVVEQSIMVPCVSQVGISSGSKQLPKTLLAIQTCRLSLLNFCLLQCSYLGCTRPLSSVSNSSVRALSTVRIDPLFQDAWPYRTEIRFLFSACFRSLALQKGSVQRKLGGRKPLQRAAEQRGRRRLVRSD